MTTSIPFWNAKQSALRSQLLAYFFTNLKTRLHVREIARLLRVDPTNLSRELRRLEREGVFVSEKRGNQKLFSLNRNYHLYGELRSMVFKTIGVEGALRSVVRQIRGIQRAFVYGSFAKDREHAGSDIDLCLIIKKGEFDEDRLLGELHLLEKKLGREISHVYYTQEEWKKKQRAKDSFVLGLLRGKRIELRDEKS